MKIAVEGCAHGELEVIYNTIKEIEDQEKVKIDLLICCGDFQSSRNEEDLRCMAVPEKYHKICSFYKYFTGEKKAPILTIFIGGNHEASNYLQELPYGGWVAPNIYYLGYAGVINVAGIRIGGLSGIYKNRDYMKGHFEKAPYDDNTKRSVYHIRNLEVFRLKQLSGPVDIFLSHDWPTGVYNYGNTKQLLKRKPFFRDEIEKGELGSKPCEEILNHLMPSYWFSAHLHCKFAALIKHNEEKITKFLALDKCLPKRKFLQVLDIPHMEDRSKIEISYDLEWLAVLYTTNHLLSVKNVTNFMPGRGGNERYSFTPTEEEKEFVLKKFNGDLTTPINFKKTAAAYNPKSPRKKKGKQPEAKLNPQTVNFCETLGVSDPVTLISEMYGLNLSITIESDDQDVLDSAQDTTFISDTDISASVNDSQLEMETSSQDSQESAPEKKIGNLSLPEPKQSNSSSDDLPISEITVEDKKPNLLEVSGSSENTMNSPKRSIGSLEVEENPMEVETEQNLKTVVENSPVPKKFKRRNAEMYKTEEEKE